MKHRSVLAVPLFLLGLGACYVQVPLETATPAPTTRITARLTDTGTVVVANRLGPGSAEVEGVVASAGADEWTLNVLRVEYRGGISSTWNREPVVFQRFTLTNVTERRLDRRRSVMAAFLIGVGAFAVTKVFGGGASSGIEEPPIVSPEV